MNLFAKAVYMARIQQGLSQAALALKAGIPQPNLSDIEKGRDFRVSTLSKLASAMDMSVEDLIQGVAPTVINKRHFFQRDNIEKVVFCVVNKKVGPPSLRPAIRLISAIRKKENSAYLTKKDAHLSWHNLKQVFTDQEIKAILSRLNKAERRSA